MIVWARAEVLVDTLHLFKVVLLIMGANLSVPVIMSSGEAKYISVAVACMRAIHLRL